MELAGRRERKEAALVKERDENKDDAGGRRVGKGRKERTD